MYDTNCQGVDGFQRRMKRRVVEEMDHGPPPKKQSMVRKEMGDDFNKVCAVTFVIHGTIKLTCVSLISVSSFLTN